MRKEKTYKEQANEATRGRKRYIERLVETREAEKQIKDYENEDSTDGSDTDRFDGDRLIDRERGKSEFP